ncbi:MAG: hypothetical protein VX938_07760, partial [Myxococcota bacterium]|nr:hypothetical protein [Myxococcota bacterium]
METSDGLGPTQNPYGGAVSDVQSSAQPVIWIANSSESTVSRLNTSTGCEEARFYTCGDPSRTAVDQDASGFIGCRSGGQLMKIATQHEFCNDLNGNGVLDTSMDMNGDCKITPDEMVQGDECILWKVTPPGASALRGAGIDAEGNIWVGASNNPSKLSLLSGETGALIKQHSIYASPYGLAIDSDGIIWVASRSPNSLTRVDPDAGEINWWPVPTGDAYGVAVDPYGKIWVANMAGGGVHRFDPVTNTWVHLGGHGNSGRGVAVRLVYGPNFQVIGAKVYVANSGVGTVDIFDAETVTHEGSINLGSNLGAVGAALDLEGFLWVVNQGGNSTHKIDTGTNTIVGTYPVGSGPYTYSDMTGYAFHTITSLTAVYRHVFEGWSYGQTTWDSVEVFAELPGDTHANVQYRVGDSPTALKDAEWSEPIGPFPPMAFPLGLNVTGKYLEVRALL